MQIAECSHMIRALNQIQNYLGFYCSLSNKKLANGGWLKFDLIPESYMNILYSNWIKCSNICHLVIFYHSVSCKILDTFYHGPCRHNRMWSTHGNSYSSSFLLQPSNEPIRAHQIPQSSSVIGWMNWNITRLIRLTEKLWGYHAMRKQQKAQLNPLARQNWGQGGAR